MNYKTQQYLADNTEADDERLQPFPSAFFVDSEAYPADAFKFYKADDIKKLIDGVQPDVLAAQAMTADKTLNNQSLVILFSFGGKNLLFAGDAQWGNWENFLYGGAFGTPGHTVITDKAKAILGKIDFYKVGHHGSTNVTPKDAVAAMRLGCVGMCSTQIHAYNEVPREPLLQALGARMNGQLARSDQVATKDVPANARRARFRTSSPIRPARFSSTTNFRHRFRSNSDRARIRSNVWTNKVETEQSAPASSSDHRRYFFQSDQAGERANLALLVLA